MNLKVVAGFFIGIVIAILVQESTKHTTMNLILLFTFLAIAIALWLYIKFSKK